MGANCVIPEEEQAKPDNVRSRGVATASVYMKVQIHADAQRLFMALTEPEFLGAWLTRPEVPTGPTPIVSRNGADLYIRFPHEGLKSEESVWKYVVRRRRKIRFWWIRNDRLRGYGTLVTIRLLGNFASTFVVLTHSGIVGSRECDFYRSLWTESLSKLSSLLCLPKVSRTEKRNLIDY